MSGAYKPGHKPAGPGGGQFTHPQRQEPGLTVGGLQVDPDAESRYPEQVASIREAELDGSLSTTEKGLVYTSADGRSFDIHQDGHTTPDGTLGWAVDNHDQADANDPAYGLRYETTTEALGETVAEAAFDSAAVEAFTMTDGSDDYELRQFGIGHFEGSPALSASFVDNGTGDDLDVYYDVDGGKLTVYFDDSEVTGREADEVLKELVDYHADGLDVPDGTPSEQMAWHMERSFRIAAAKDGSPEWTHVYRVEGLSWNDRA